MRKFLRDASGATMVEYGLLVALLAIACVGGLALVGPKLQTVFETVSTSV